MKTNISKRLFRELETLADSTPATLSSLAEDLTSIAPQLYPFNSLIGIVRASVSGLKLPGPPGGGENQADFAVELGQSLTALLYTAGSSSLSGEEVIAAAIETIETNFPAHAESLSAFVRRIFTCRNLLLSFKSTALREDNENIVVDSKVIVDIRPTFSFDPSEAISAHTLLYRLKITHRTSNDVETKIYTLSQDAIEELSRAVDRSKGKIEQLRSVPLEKTLGLLLEERK